MKVKYFVIEINIGEGWVSFEDAEYDNEKEVDKELRELRSHFKSDRTMKFRKKCIGEYDAVRLYAKGTIKH